MINLTSQEYNTREFIQTVFSPLVGVLSSSSANELCMKNNLTFVEIIHPFCKLVSDAYIRDSSGTNVSIKGLKINFCNVEWQPPSTNIVRKLLSDAVSSAQLYNLKTVNVNNNIVINIPSEELWFEQWREMFFSVQFQADHEFTRHFIGCIIVLSSKDLNIVETASTLTKKVSTLQNTNQPQLPKWFSNDTLICYLMLHDASAGDISKYVCLKYLF